MKYSRREVKGLAALGLACAIVAGSGLLVRGRNVAKDIPVDTVDVTEQIADTTHSAEKGKREKKVKKEARRKKKGKAGDKSKKGAPTRDHLRDVIDTE